MYILIILIFGTHATNMHSIVTMTLDDCTKMKAQVEKMHYSIKAECVER